MKKSFTRFLSLLFVFCIICLSTIVKAQEPQKTVQLYADNTSVCYSTSNEYEVKISIQDFIQLVKFNGVLHYESSVFSYKSSTLTGSLSGLNITESFGNVTFAWDNGITPVTFGQGVKTDVAILKFSIKHFPSNLASSYLSLLSWSKADFYDVAGKKFDMTNAPAVGGKLNVSVNLVNVQVQVNPVGCPGIDANVIVTSPAEGTGFMYLFNEDPDPSKWTWSSSSTSSAPANSTNIVRIKDSNGCMSLQKEFTVTNTDPVAYTASSQDALCYGGNGEVLLSPIGGTAPYTYWVVPNGDFGSVQTILASLAGKNATSLNKYKKTTSHVLRPAGDYKVAVDDANYCNDLTVIGYWTDLTIKQPVKPLSISISDIQSETCNNANDGSFKVTLANGTLGEYRVSVPGKNDVTAGGSFTFTNMAPDTYKVTALDANGCTIVSGNIVILEKALITFAINVNNTSCNGLNDGQIDVSNIQGGTAPYNLSIVENGIPTTQTNVNGTAYSFVNLKPTYYALTITDANNCSVNYSNPNNSGNVIAVQSPTDINISNIELTNPLCFDGNATLKAMGITGGSGAGYLYSMDQTTWQASNAFIVLQPFLPSYTIFVKNAIGYSCVVSQSTSLNQVAAPGQLIASPGEVTSPTCAEGNDGKIKVDISGGTTPYSYSVNEGAWMETTNALEINNATVGNYSINIKDAHGCLISGPLAFSLLQDKNIITATANKIDCFGNKTVIDASWTSWANGGISRSLTYMYSSTESSVFTTGTGFVPGTTLFSAGTYYVGAVDQFGCSSEPVAVLVAQNAELIISSVVANGATCYGSTRGVITVQATGGTVAGLLQYVLLTDEAQLNNIDESKWINFETYDPALTLSSVSFQVDKGVYFIAVRDNHCENNRKNYGPITVTGYDQLLVKESLIVKTDVLCSGSGIGSLNVPANAVSGGAGAYLFTLLDGSGSAVAGKIQRATGLFDNLLAGTYSVLVEDSNGCPSYTTKPYTLTEPLFLTFTTDINYFSCNNSNDGLITIHIDGGVAPYTYSINKKNWISFTGSSKTHVATEPGIFSVWIKDANGCVKGPNIVEIKMPAKLVPTVNVVSNELCNGGNDAQITVSATGGWVGMTIFNYKVDNGVWSAGATIGELTAGTHILYVKDVASYNGLYQNPKSDCISSVSFTITEPDPIVYSVNITDVKCKGGNDGTFTVSVQSGQSPFYTNDGNDANDGYDITLTGTGYSKTVRSGIGNKVTFTGLSPLLYTVFISDAKGCSLKATIGDKVAPFETTESWNVNEPQIELTVFPELVKNVSCSASADGKFKINATGGTAPYKYYAAYSVLADGTVLTPEVPIAGSNEWKDSNEFTGAAGTWIVWVTDANGCMRGGNTNLLGQPDDTWSIKVDQPQQITWSFASPSFTEPTGYGKEDGKIYLTNVTGGNSVYTAVVTGTSGDNVSKVYSQSISGPTGWTINNVGASDANGFMVKVIDSNNCESVVQSVLVTQPTLLAVTLEKGVDSFTCPDVVEGLIEATAVGGVAPYTFSLFKDGILHTKDVIPSAFFVQIGHTFKVIVKDANGNTANASIEVNRVQPIVATATDITCFGNEKAIAKITATGEPGRTFIVQYAPVVNGVEGTKSDEIPFDNFINISDLTYGINRFYVSDNVGCPGSMLEVDFVKALNPLAVAIVSSSDELSATITITGGTAPYSYQVGSGEVIATDGQAFIVSNLNAPQTVVTIYDAHGCSVIKSISVAPIWVIASPSSGDNQQNSFQVALTFNRTVTIGAGDIGGGTYIPGTGTAFTVTLTGEDLSTLTLAPGTGIKDAAGNAFAGKSFTYKVGDHAAPTLIVTPPQAPVASLFKVILKFSEPVKGISFGCPNITATNGKITNISGSGDSYTLTIASKEQANVTIVLNSGIKDVSSNTNAFAGITLTYTIGDFTAPKLVTLYPTANDVLVDNHPTFKMTFSESVKLGAGGNLTVYKMNTNTPLLTLPLTANMIVDKVVTVPYTVTADKGLTLNTRYYVLVSAKALTDNAGNKFGGVNDLAVWTFRTGSKWPTGTIELNNSLEFKVYPNPFGDVIHVSNASELSKVVVTNVAGQVVKEVVNPTNDIQLNELRSGIYFISLFDKDNVIAKTAKIIKR